MTNYVAALANPASPYYSEACRLARQVRLEATITDGVIRWNSNGRVPPIDIVELAASNGLPIDVAACTDARDAELAEFLAEYRKARAAGPSAEERAEARAAHGAGVELVNVITGYRWRT